MATTIEQKIEECFERNGFFTKVLNSKNEPYIIGKRDSLVFRVKVTKLSCGKEISICRYDLQVTEDYEFFTAKNFKSFYNFFLGRI